MLFVLVNIHRARCVATMKGTEKESERFAVNTNIQMWIKLRFIRDVDLVLVFVFFFCFFKYKFYDRRAHFKMHKQNTECGICRGFGFGWKKERKEEKKRIGVKNRVRPNDHGKCLF